VHPGINRHFDITKAVHAAEVATTKPKNADRKAYLVGGGIGSLAAAAFMIRDGGVPGRNITIYEAMPVLRRSHEHHRDLQPRLDTAIQTAAANRDQDRYVMITFPTSQIQNPVLPRRPSIRHGGARANMPLPRQRRHRSSWLTADSRTCDRPIMRRNVVSQHTHRRRLPSPTSVVRKPP
jgi:hypothetical protein